MALTRKPAPSPKARRTESVSSALRALSLLEVLGSARGSLSPAEVGQRADVTRPSAYRLLGTLEKDGWVVRDSTDSRRFRLGRKVLELAGQALASYDLREVSLPRMRAFAAEHEESISLWALEGRELVFLDKVHSERPLQAVRPLGRRGPLHSKAVGKAVLATMPEEEVRAILAAGMPAQTRRTLTSPAKLFAELPAIRERGYGFSLGEDVELLHAVGAAIVNAEGRPVGGLAVSMIAAEATLKRLDFLGRKLREVCTGISVGLGSGTVSPS